MVLNPSPVRPGVIVVIGNQSARQPEEEDKEQCHSY